jgi:hypothetical protein
MQPIMVSVVHHSQHQQCYYWRPVFAHEKNNMQQLIDKSGKVTYATFDAPVETINYRDFDLRNSMDNPVGFLKKRMGFNQFQFIAVTGPELIFGMAIVNLKWVNNCFAYCYEPATGKFQEFSTLLPLSFGSTVNQTPNKGCWRFAQGKNFAEIRCENQQRIIEFYFDGMASGELYIDEHTHYQPLAVCCRAGYTGFVYTQKSTALPVTGNIKWGETVFNAGNLLASVDWSAGYMRRETFWLWSSLSCRLENGQTLGFNLAAGVNETSFTENALWLDGELIKLDRADFIFDRSDRQKPWKICSSDGVLALEFIPEGKRCEKVNAGLLASNFTQLFGKYYGQVTLADGRIFSIDGQYGFAEDHYAKW